MIIAAFVPNIFDRSRFGGEHRGRVTFVDDAGELSTLTPDFVVVDLDRCPDPGSFVATGADGNRRHRTIGFGPHIEAEAHRRAKEIGFDEVLPRSRFFRQLAELLADPESVLQPPDGDVSQR